MSELERLLDGENDELALAMLRAGRDEGPSKKSLEAAALALGISGAALSIGAPAAASGAVAALGAASPKVGVGALAASAGSPASSLTAAIIAKHVLVGMLGGAVAMGGVNYAVDRAATPAAPVTSAKVAAMSPRAAQRPSAAVLTGASRTPSAELAEVASPAVSPATTAVSARKAVSNPSFVHSADPAPVVAVTIPTSAEPAPQPSAAAFAAEPAPSAAPAAPSATALNKSLALDIALLDRARAALQAGHAERALAALAQYQQKRQSAILDPEATVIRIGALSGIGERAAAARLARAFVQKYPQSRHVEVLRALAAENSPH